MLTAALDPTRSFLDDVNVCLGIGYVGSNEVGHFVWCIVSDLCPSCVLVRGTKWSAIKLSGLFLVQWSDQYPECYYRHLKNILQDLLSATIGRTLTPLLFFTPPDRGSVKRVGILFCVDSYECTQRSELNLTLWYYSYGMTGDTWSTSNCPSFELGLSPNIWIWIW